MIQPHILNSLILCLKSNIKNKNIDTSSALKIITLSMELIEEYPDLTSEEKKLYIITALEEIAKGNDNISGTEDDALTPECLESLKLIINNNLISDIITIICDASKGNFNINKIKKTCFSFTSCLLK